MKNQVTALGAQTVRASQRVDVRTSQLARARLTIRVRISGPLSSNSGELVRDWRAVGHGIMLRCLWNIAPQLVTGELVRVLTS